MDYLDPSREIQKHRHRLPHWQQGEALQFVTFRLGDSMPVEQLAQWKAERDIWLAHHPKPWSPSTEKDYQRDFIWKLETWLDEGGGSCLLKDPANRGIVAKVLMRFQGVKVEHHAWVVMPNHVHLLFAPKTPIEKLVQAWKGVSARQIGQGGIWQKNYRDTLIRDEEHFENAVRYIRRNPAKLPPGTFTLWQGPTALAVP